MDDVVEMVRATLRDLPPMAINIRRLMDVAETAWSAVGHEIRPWSPSCDPESFLEMVCPRCLKHAAIDLVNADSGPAYALLLLPGDTCRCDDAESQPPAGDATPAETKDAPDGN